MRGSAVHDVTAVPTNAWLRRARSLNCLFMLLMISSGIWKGSAGRAVPGPVPGFIPVTNADKLRFTGLMCTKGVLVSDACESSQVLMANLWRISLLILFSGSTLASVPGTMDDL